MFTPPAGSLGSTSVVTAEPPVFEAAAESPVVAAAVPLAAAESPLVAAADPPFDRDTGDGFLVGLTESAFDSAADEDGLSKHSMSIMELGRNGLSFMVGV